MGVDVASSNGYAGRQTGPLRGLRGQSSGRCAQRQQVVGKLVREVGEGRVEGRQVLPGRVTVLGPDPLVAGRADVAGLGAGQLPDDPVGGLDPAVGPRVELGVLLQELETLGELPLGGDLAAVPVEP
jgi:hypothetical protein